MSQKKLKKETILQYLAKPAVYTLIREPILDFGFEW
jgi:hypothetical protein